MNRYVFIVTTLVVLTLVWLGLVLNTAEYYFDYGNESNLLFRNINIQFKVVYIFGIVLNFMYLYLILSQKYRKFF